MESSLTLAQMLFSTPETIRRPQLGPANQLSSLVTLKGSTQGVKTP